MKRERLTPGVEHGHKADLGPEMFGIGGDLPQGLRGSMEEQIVDDPFVLQADLSDRLGQCENHMEITDRQQLGLPRLQPPGLGCGLTLRAMPVPTGVVRNLPGSTIRAGLDMSTQLGSPTDLDGAHDPQMMHGQAAAMILSVDVAVAAQHIGHLPRWPSHQRRMVGSESNGLLA